MLGECGATRQIHGTSPISVVLCGDNATVQRAMKNAEEVSREKNSDTLWNGTRLALIRAAVEYSRGKPEKAVDLLRSMKYERAYPFATYLRGLSYLKLQQGAEATAEFQKIVEYKGANWAHCIHCPIWAWLGD